MKYQIESQTKRQEFNLALTGQFIHNNEWYKRLKCLSYHSCPKIDPHDCGLMDNHPVDIACCLIIFCQIIDELCEAMERKLQGQLDKIGKAADQCKNIPALVKRHFEPLVPFIVADMLAQE